MAGKSTILRMSAIIIIIAQIGCFVPAKECKFTKFDQIFIKTGASDKILEGMSTFFVEM